MKQRFFTFIWNLSEFLYIDLGPFAPFVFGQMIGIKGVRIDEKTEKTSEDAG